MYIYIGIWEHRHGVDALAVQSESKDLPTEDQFVKANSDLDWELDREDEWLSIMPFPMPECIPVITKEDIKDDDVSHID